MVLSRSTTRATPFSDHALLHPKLHRRATVGAELHSLRADATRALMPAGRGEVSLWASKAHDARRIAADGGFRSIVAASDVADIGERQHRLSRRRRRLEVLPKRP